MANKETTLSKVKVGDLIWGNDGLGGRISFPKIVNRVTDTMVFTQAYRLAVRDAHMINNPAYFKTLGLKGLKTWGDHWDGGASFPIAGNEMLVGFGPETKQKKTYKHRGVVREHVAFVVDRKDAEIKYDFYTR
jgi:hypothetical protein